MDSEYDVCEISNLLNCDARLTVRNILKFDHFLFWFIFRYLRNNYHCKSLLTLLQNYFYRSHSETLNNTLNLIYKMQYSKPKQQISWHFRCAELLYWKDTEAKIEKIQFCRREFDRCSNFYEWNLVVSYENNLAFGVVETKNFAYVVLWISSKQSYHDSVGRLFFLFGQLFWCSFRAIFLVGVKYRS